MDGTSESLALGTILIGLFGGLALFLAGMEQMSQALKAVAGEGMRKILANLTKNRFMAAGTGAFVTAVIQSSSVTTVLVVGFISAGIMTLPQSVGVIMGANVGTTITAQIVAFKITKYALVLVAAGFAMEFFVKKEKVRQYGAMVMGLGLIFFGMSLMSDATEDLEALVAHNEDSTRLYEAIVAYMARLSRLELSSAATRQLAALGGVANTIDNMGDTIATNLVWLGRERLEARIEPSEATVEAFKPLRDAVLEAFRRSVDAVRDQDPHAALEVIAIKGRVQSLARDVNAHLAERIAAAGPERVTAYRIESDAVEILQRLYYFAKRVAKAVVEAAGVDDREGRVAA